MKNYQNAQILHDICSKINEVPELYMKFAGKNYQNGDNA